MPVSYLYYNLQNGFVDNWLVAGPQSIQVADPEKYIGEDFKLAIVRQYYEADSGIHRTPVERGPLSKGTFRVGTFEGAWSYYRCREDHYIDHSADYPVCHYLRSWAYAQVMSDQPQEVILELSANGPTDVWLDGQQVGRKEDFNDPRPGCMPIKLSFRKGANKILVRFENVAIRACPHLLALRVRQADESATKDQPVPGLRVRLPTTIEDVRRRNQLERVFEAAYLDRDVYAQQEEINLRWPEDMPESAITTARLQTPNGQIYAQADGKGSPGDRAFLGHAAAVKEGPYQAFIMPGPREYYEGNRRIQRAIEIWSMGNNPTSSAPYDTLDERRQEALKNAAQHSGTDIFTEMARMALNRWNEVDSQTVRETIAQVNQHQAGSPLLLLGLCGIFYHFGGYPDFPASLKQPLEECLLNFQYWPAEQSTQLPDGAALNYQDQEQRIVLHACEILAGQRFPDRAFLVSGQTGQWHRAHGEGQALAWMAACAANGFSQWDSQTFFSNLLTTLAHLIDLAETEAVWELASVLMDKTLLSLAINSYKGIFGSTHRRASALALAGGLLEPTAGISRLMWGMGTFNHHLAGPVSLALLEKYEFPGLIADIATQPLEEMWNRERHLLITDDRQLQDEATEVNKVTYKTPDGMLCSVQDYRPGQKGSQEHIWQATLGPEAVVFVTHPACASIKDANRPNFWAGNNRLPRVAQWKDALIAIYNLPEDDWLGFTHAYFPIYAFDEYVLSQDAAGHTWAMARKEDGYLALCAAKGFRLIEQGHSAYRELRSDGRQNTWLCHLGRAALDGDFRIFQEKILGMEVVFDDLSVRWRTLRGDDLAFGWEGAFQRNAEAQSLHVFKHYENPYMLVELPCKTMEVRYTDFLLRLDFNDM